MDVYIDHYLVLGLPSGEKGTKISDKDITKAYKIKALELHPDKKPNDPNAVINFQNLQASYEILKDESSRKKFDADLIRRVKLQQYTSNKFDKKEERKPQQERKKSDSYDVRTRWNDFNEKEGDVSEKPTRKRAYDAEYEEWARKRAAYEERRRKEKAALKAFHSIIKFKAKKEVYRSVDKENVLEVFWAKGGLDYYSEKRLRGTFTKFGEVKDVFMSSVFQGSAIIVMATKYGVAAAVKAGKACGDPSNPLIVRPLGQPV
uniref:dnaJ homolog subfamily C member 17-like n=1 Tax=Erigeron canadensis TaxID=72917 RepID=UPI001CB9608B|nr:dnaJ homolog subfamily C member 17-like [Erigeron canadensis]